MTSERDTDLAKTTLACVSLGRVPTAPAARLTGWPNRDGFFNPVIGKQVVPVEVSGRSYESTACSCPHEH